MIRITNGPNTPAKRTTLWHIPVGTTFTGIIVDCTDTPLLCRGLFLRGQGWVARLDPTPAFPRKHHVGWSLSERDHNGEEHRDIRVLSYCPVNLGISVEQA